MYPRISPAKLVNMLLTAAISLSAITAIIPFQMAEAAAKAPVTKKVVAVAKPAAKKPAVKAKAPAKKAVIKKTAKKIAAKSKKGNGTSRLLGNELIDPNNPPGGR